MNNNKPLQAKDLMLGDWVLWGYTTASGVKVGGYKMQVAAVYQDDLVDLVDSDSLYEQVPMDEVEAIPLTEKVLEKNADIVKEWMDTEEIWARSANNDDNASVIFHEREGWKRNMEGTAVRRYVHELQHALRLAGIGKEIEL